MEELHPCPWLTRNTTVILGNEARAVLMNITKELRPLSKQSLSSEEKGHDPLWLTVHFLMWLKVTFQLLQNQLLLLVPLRKVNKNLKMGSYCSTTMCHYWDICQ